MGYALLEPCDHAHAILMQVAMSIKALMLDLKSPVSYQENTKSPLALLEDKPALLSRLPRHSV